MQAPYPQASIYYRPPEPMSEDCLYLNIWTAAQSAKEHRPVMVWVHGGGFTRGSGSVATYDGENLAKKGAIVVTINYRLGTDRSNAALEQFKRNMAAQEGLGSNAESHYIKHMGYIPNGAKWYIADIVREFEVEGENEDVVHIDTTLVRADSPEEAFEKSLALGRAGEDSYRNPFGKLVTVLFRGLRNLNVVDGELEHGTELLFERKEGVSQGELRDLVREKDQLNVFRPIKSYVDDTEAPEHDAKNIRLL